MSLWNSKDLVPPPIMTCNCDITPKNLTMLKCALFSGIKSFKDNKLFLAERILLQRIIYRLKTKFRSAKDMKSLSKLHSALRNYFTIETEKHLTEFMELLPENVEDDCLYLPTRNLLDFILVRLQGLSKLLERVYETCKIAASDVLDRIKVGHFWKIAVICLAVVSRVCILTKTTLQSICDLYNKLHLFTYVLNNTSFQWLPKGYTLPKDLKEWLNVKWIDEDFSIDTTELDKQNIIDFFNLVDSEDDLEICDEYVLVDENDDVEFISEFKNLVKKHNRNNIVRGFNLDEDGNEIIDLSEQTNPEQSKDPKNNEIGCGDVNKNNIFRGYIEEEDIGEEIVEIPDEESKICIDDSNDENASVVFVDQKKKSKKKRLRVIDESVELVEDSRRIDYSNDENDSVIFVDQKKKSRKKRLRVIDNESVIEVEDSISQLKKSKLSRKDTNLDFYSNKLKHRKSNVLKKKKIKQKH